MAKKYENEYKTTIVELLGSGRTVKEVSQEYQLNDSMIRRWRREYKERNGDMSQRVPLTEMEKEIRALKKELRDVKIERDIFKMAVSIFSKSDR
jgi:transposase